MFPTRQDVLVVAAAAAVAAAAVAVAAGDIAAAAADASVAAAVARGAVKPIAVDTVRGATKPTAVDDNEADGLAVASVASVATASAVSSTPPPRPWPPPRGFKPVVRPRVPAAPPLLVSESSTRARASRSSWVSVCHQQKHIFIDIKIRGKAIQNAAVSFFSSGAHIVLF